MVKSIFTGYIGMALARAEFNKLDDGTLSGRLPGFKGVIAFGKTLRECEMNCMSTFEDWVLVGLKLGHLLPVIDEYDLDREPEHESMAAV